MSSSGGRQAQGGQGGNQRLSKGQKLAQMARKRDERVVRQAYRKEKKAQGYLADDEIYTCFRTQLAKMGLQLRDIPGDGNCLFRALGDQFQGHGRDHLKHRRDVVKYVLDHRADFEPFVEDDVPFDRHVKNLNQIGTYAGNDAIVAFARLHTLTVVIHQVNSPCWQIHGSEKPNSRQLHISYHNGDHYSSVRKLGDDSECPANIRLEDTVNQTLPKPGKHPQKSGPPSSTHGSSTSSAVWSGEYEVGDMDSLHLPALTGDEVGLARAVCDTDDIVEHVMNRTGCLDRDLVQQTLEEHFYDVETAEMDICQILTASMADCSPHSNAGVDACAAAFSNGGLSSEDGCGTRIYGSFNGQAGSARSHSGAKPKEQMSTARRKRDKKQEKKARATERRKQQLLGQSGTSGTLSTSSEDDEHNSVVLVADKMGTLKI